MEARAYRSDLSVYISVDHGPPVEVAYISFPRFSGTHCSYSSLVEEQRQRLDANLAAAERLCERFNADRRQDLSEAVIQKAFQREVS